MVVCVSANWQMGKFHLHPNITGTGFESLVIENGGMDGSL